MKNLTLLLLCCCSSLLLFGQPPSDEVEINGETFKVKKIVVRKAVDSIPTTVAAPPEKTVSKTIRVEKKGEVSPFEKAATLPTFARGEYSLMQIKVYDSGMQLQGQKYVVLHYIINKYGWAQNIKIHDTNDRHLVSIVLKKLKGTQWNPAKNQKGEAINYLAKKQVVIVNDRTYDEDYYDNY